MEHDEVPDRVIVPEPTPGPLPILSLIPRLVDGAMTVVDRP